MKLIPEQEAQQYIPCKEDYFGRPAVFYTLTPDPTPGWERWEVVTYYTAKKRNEYVNREGAGNSWVYILTNPTIPGLCKIGYTKETPEQRAREVSRGTGIAMPFEVAWAFQCFDGEMLEYEVHKYLEEYRENSQREFFRIDIEQAKNAIEVLGARYAK